MSDRPWTSGPWRTTIAQPRKVCTDGGVVICVTALDNNGHGMAKPRHRKNKSIDEAEANARLIAAAPEMAQLLRELVSPITNSVGLAGAQMEARALLARVDKARTLISSIEGENS